MTLIIEDIINVRIGLPDSTLTLVALPLIWGRAFVGPVADVFRDPDGDAWRIAPSCVDAAPLCDLISFSRFSQRPTAECSSYPLINFRIAMCERTSMA
jgi:hypothetical protein